ncbi:MAG: ATP-binding cassette domain-containing protein [Deltaproteobacteria bacterium]|nr:ATP-binding cassette domain-containing protein [Deltaproteobacteria bacterium]
MSLVLEKLAGGAAGFALENLDLEISRGGYFILLGPTGAGKSTLLKCILGLHPLTAGRILLDGRDLTRLPVEKRNIGYLPQNCALFPHLDVRENILFGLRAAKLPRKQLAVRLAALVALLELEPLLTRPTASLSGGEKQKVALARALATRPSLLLLDEPFAAVDEGSKRKLWLSLRQVCRRLAPTVIHVTHNFEEAYAMGREVGVLIDGRLEQVTNMQNLFERPASRRVARFLNYNNLFHGRPRPIGPGRYELVDRRIRIVFSHPRELTGPVTLCVRPQDIKILNPAYPVKQELAANVYRARIRSPDADFELRFPRYIFHRHRLAEGQEIQIALWQPQIIVLEK